MENVHFSEHFNEWWRHPWKIASRLIVWGTTGLHKRVNLSTSLKGRPTRVTGQSTDYTNGPNDRLHTRASERDQPLLKIHRLRCLLKVMIAERKHRSTSHSGVQHALQHSAFTDMWYKRFQQMIAIFFFIWSINNSGVEPSDGRSAS